MSLFFRRVRRAARVTRRAAVSDEASGESVGTSCVSHPTVAALWGGGWVEIEVNRVLEALVLGTG